MVPRPAYGSARLVVVVLALSIAGFLATISASQVSAGRIRALADDALIVSFPSIDALANLRTSVLEVELALADCMYQASGHDVAARTLAQAQAHLGAQFAAYVALPLADGEQSRWSALQRAFGRFEASVDRARDLSDTDQHAAAQWFQRIVQPAAAQLVELALETLRFHAERGHVAAREVKVAHERSRWVAFAFGGLWALVSMLGILLVVRQARQRKHAANKHAQFVDARMQELEAFAGRVAHDLRNPLSVARLAFQLMSRNPGIDAKAHAQSTRGIRSIQAAEAIITGLLEFARAGAAPEPGARTDVGETVVDMLEGLHPEAQLAGVDLDLNVGLPPGQSALVACSPGVYLSCVGNLVRNAMKYMGDSATERRIVVHIGREYDTIKTQVTDTGPGIPLAIQASVFEPFFRARGAGQGGIGLGLATVRRLVEGHGGKVGIVSTPGSGSTFWFTLPGASVTAQRGDKTDAAARLESSPTH